jgi:hypothetical protein
MPSSLMIAEQTLTGDAGKPRTTTSHARRPATHGGRLPGTRPVQGTETHANRAQIVCRQFALASIGLETVGLKYDTGRQRNPNVPRRFAVKAARESSGIFRPVDNLPPACRRLATDKVLPRQKTATENGPARSRCRQPSSQSHLPAIHKRILSRGMARRSVDRPYPHGLV